MNDADVSRTASATHRHSPEHARLAALARYGGLDRPPEPAAERSRALGRIAETARRSAGLDIGVIALIGRDEQRILACAGEAAARFDLEAGARLPRSHTISLDTLELRNTLIVPDATTDPRARRHPLVTREGGIRSCLGAPIVSPDGHALGMVLALGLQPREGFDGAAVALQWMLAADALELLTSARFAQAS